MTIAALCRPLRSEVVGQFMDTFLRVELWSVRRCSMKKELLKHCYPKLKYSKGGFLKDTNKIFD